MLLTAANVLFLGRNICILFLNCLWCSKTTILLECFLLCTVAKMYGDRIFSSGRGGVIGTRQLALGSEEYTQSFSQEKCFEQTAREAYG